VGEVGQFIVIAIVVGISAALGGAYLLAHMKGHPIAVGVFLFGLVALAAGVITLIWPLLQRA
jgi:hypothetical protein